MEEYQIIRKEQNTDTSDLQFVSKLSILILIDFIT